MLLTTTAMELLHHVRVRAEAVNESAASAMKIAETDILQTGLLLMVPESAVIGEAYQILMEYGLDPFDSILVAAAKIDGADAIIFRDRKLAKKTKSFVPVLTPEQFLK